MFSPIFNASTEFQSNIIFLKLTLMNILDKNKQNREINNVSALVLVQL
jgi:hypothetical protein